MREYVVGFMFTRHRDQVLLIRKGRPAWQAGRLNGVGGKVEPGEFPPLAMVREFAEETGVATDAADWREFAVLLGEDYRVRCYTGASDILVSEARTVTDEEVQLLDVIALHRHPVVASLSWLVPLAAYEDLDGSVTVRVL